MLIVHDHSGETRDLEFVEADVQVRVVRLRWPMLGYVEFEVDTGHGKKKVSQWRLAPEARKEAAKLLEARRGAVESMLRK